MREYEVTFENGSVLYVYAADIPDVEDQLLEMGFESRQIVRASINFSVGVAA